MFCHDVRTPLSPAEVALTPTDAVYGCLCEHLHAHMLKNLHTMCNKDACTELPHVFFLSRVRKLSTLLRVILLLQRRPVPLGADRPRLR